jgi:hypothetical protein
MPQRAPRAFIALLILTLAVAGCSRPSAPPTDTGQPTDTSARAPAGPLPAPCEAYLAALQTCVDRVAQRNPASAAQLRAQIARTRATLSRTDTARMASTCDTANRFFRSMSGMMGCGS